MVGDNSPTIAVIFDPRLFWPLGFKIELERLFLLNALCHPFRNWEVRFQAIIREPPDSGVSQGVYEVSPVKAGRPNLTEFLEHSI